MSDLYSIVLITLAFIIIILLVVVLIKSGHKDNIDINKDLRDFNNSLNQNLNNLSNYLNTSINSLKDTTNDRLLTLSNSITKVDEAQNSLKGLSLNIDQLTKIFTDKKTRGNFGETELYTLLKQVYGEEGTFWSKQYKITTKDNDNVFVDAAITGFANNEIIGIDSKFPLENYLRMHDDSIDDDTKHKYNVDFKNNVKKHIDDIKHKYIIDGVTSDLAFMFVPSEAIYTEIYSNFSDLITYSYDNHVYITSPTTLMAYLTAVKNIYLDFKKEQNIKNIIKCLNDLSEEFNRFDTRNKELLDEFTKFEKKYNDLNITTEKIIKKFAKITDFEDSSND